MPHYAHVVNVRTKDDTAREFDSPDLAARNLAMLLRRQGYDVGKEGIIARLLLGQTLTHKGFAYRVSDKP